MDSLSRSEQKRKSTRNQIVARMLDLAEASRHLILTLDRRFKPVNERDIESIKVDLTKLRIQLDRHLHNGLTLDEERRSICSLQTQIDELVNLAEQEGA